MASFLAAISTTLSGQPIGFGIKAGIPLTDPVQVQNAGQQVNTHRWIVGPTVEVRLPFHFAVEADALYRTFDYHTELSQVLPASIKASTSLWEVPLLVKYRLPGVPLMHPFVDAGPVWGRASLSATASCSGVLCGTLQGTRNFSGIYNGAGFTLGGGLEIHPLLLRIAPEIRYTHWGPAIFGHSFGANEQFAQNQAEFLVGISF
ncbi:MAG: hypothetical protein ACRD4P_09120 [Bryobacteraceae bacterium]